MIDTCDENIIAMYHITADDRVMGSVSGAKKLLQTVQNSKYITKDEEEINRIYVSLICPNSDKVIDPDSYAAQLVETSGGVIYTAAEENNIQPVFFTSLSYQETTPSISSYRSSAPYNAVQDNLTEILGDGETYTYQILVSTGLTPIKLKNKL